MLSRKNLGRGLEALLSAPQDEKLGRGLEDLVRRDAATTPAKPTFLKAEKPKSVLVAANFPPEVARALRLVLADPRNDGRTKKSLLAEAINDLCVKYGVDPVASLDG